MAGHRPDILFILTEQQRFDTIAALGYPHMETPNLDRLVREGVAFTHAFVAGPTCVTARASLFNGVYAHTSGILHNQSVWRRSFVHSLADAGYHCVNIGKMHTNPYDAESGFHERYIVENKDRVAPDQRYFLDEWDKALRARGLEKPLRPVLRQRPEYQTALGALDWLLPADMHADNFIGDFATYWLKTMPRRQPLFLQVGFAGPHPPYDPLPEIAARYLDKHIPVLPVSPVDLAAQPEALNRIRINNINNDRDSIVFRPDASMADRHRQRAYYLANVTMIDAQVGAILRTYEELGRLDDLIVVFSSDHGDSLGDHGHSQKWTMYDPVVRVPVVVWSPGRFSGGRRYDDLLQTMDVGATILELAGGRTPVGMEARSFAAALRGEPWRGRDHVYSEQSRDRVVEVDFVTMVRSRTHKLVHYLGEPSGQLFDLSADPDEEINLWDSAPHALVRQQMLDTLRDWLIESNAMTSEMFAEWR